MKIPNIRLRLPNNTVGFVVCKTCGEIRAETDEMRGKFYRLYCAECEYWLWPHFKYGKREKLAKNVEMHFIKDMSTIQIKRMLWRMIIHTFSIDFNYPIEYSPEWRVKATIDMFKKVFESGRTLMWDDLSRRQKRREYNDIYNARLREERQRKREQREEELENYKRDMIKCEGGVCDILKAHHNALEDDPERLTTDFIMKLVCGEIKTEKYLNKRYSEELKPQITISDL